MAENNPNPWLHRATPEAVAASTGGTAWTVALDDRPALPADVAEMVAPPIVVCAAPTTPRVVAPPPVAKPRPDVLLYRMNMVSPPPPGGRHRRRARAS